MHIFQTPAPDSAFVRCCGDVFSFRIRPEGRAHGKAYLRTNLNRARLQNREIVARREMDIELSPGFWRDLPMVADGSGGFSLDIALRDAGSFEAKAFFKDADGHIYWPPGGNIHIKVQPSLCASANTIYSIFVRQFQSKPLRITAEEREYIEHFQQAGYTVIPPSGTFRNIIGELDFIIKELRFRWLLFLPVNPVPVEYGKMGTYGSPYASQDYFTVDSSLAVFDQSTTPMEQFYELIEETHARGAKVMLDIPANHTGWASRLHMLKPEFFTRSAACGLFHSPGAWGIVWQDLVELDYGKIELWDYMAEVFLFWCRKGVDGFRLDAGYMLPVAFWTYLTARVRLDFPETVFLLEGLGGPLETMDDILSSAGVTWAYSELFQVYTKEHLRSYFEAYKHRSTSRGELISFSETHDNDRLAARSHRYARYRTALCAMLSFSGGFGLSNGAEWYAEEKIRVHESNDLNIGVIPNMCGLVRRINTLLSIHPCFYNGSDISAVDGVPQVLVETGNEEGAGGLLFFRKNGDRVLLIAINTGDQPILFTNFPAFLNRRLQRCYDLLDGNSRHPYFLESGLKLVGQEVLCLGTLQELEQLEKQMRDENFEHSSVIKQICQGWAASLCGTRTKCDLVNKLSMGLQRNPEETLRGFIKEKGLFYSHIELPAVRRVIPVPFGQRLFLTASCGFRAAVSCNGSVLCSAQAVPDGNGRFFALLFLPRKSFPSHCHLQQICFEEDGIRRYETPLLLLPSAEKAVCRLSCNKRECYELRPQAILTNSRGSYAQVRAEWGQILSKYDAFLAVNSDPQCPSDRQIVVSGFLGWVQHNGYSKSLDLSCLQMFSGSAGNRAGWRFTFPVGRRGFVHVDIALSMHEHEDKMYMDFRRTDEFRHERDRGNKLFSEPVRLILRPLVEDRINHNVLKAFSLPESVLEQKVRTYDKGFVLEGEPEAGLFIDKGYYKQKGEWFYNQTLPVEQERGLNSVTDRFSPGYFLLELDDASVCSLFIGADYSGFPVGAAIETTRIPDFTFLSGMHPHEAMLSALRRFWVRRGRHFSVMAGYPWFLDWGRDSLIALRGFLAAGFFTEAREILLGFAELEKDGTLPNVMIAGDDTNRETSDAPLWFIKAVDDYCRMSGDSRILERPLSSGERLLKDVLLSIVDNYMKGAPNGVAMDGRSGLIFSPSHYTWMDTNHPAGTPRKGYPVEIQALWYAALRFVFAITRDVRWEALAQRVSISFEKLFCLNGHGLVDCLHADDGQSAFEAEPDDAVRSNQLFAVTLGLIQDRLRAARVVDACSELLCPGALRSLADRPVKYSLPIHGAEGELLNDPLYPYKGLYSGDEDTKRKPAYHNGTAWMWTFPAYCEALVIAYGVGAAESALSLLYSGFADFKGGALGNVAEVCDGDAPHANKGCFAQAWSVSEIIRVEKFIRTFIEE
jgi:predicted glycogen debranching enzyme